MTAIPKQSSSSTRRSHSSGTTRSTSRTRGTTSGRQTQKQPTRKADQARVSQDVSAQSNVKQVPNFQSWASPNAAKSSELKPLSGDSMGRKDKGDNVKQLQEHLNKSGAKLEADGNFGPATQKAVRKFQRQNNLTVDGKVGPETMGALNKGLSLQKPESKAGPEDKKADPQAKKAEPAQKPEEAKKADPGAKKAQGLPQLAGKNLTPQEKYDHYAAMVQAAGGKIDPSKPTVLGLRGLGVDGQRHDSGRNTGSNDDTFVVLGRDKKGQPTVTELSGATHAATAKGSVAGGVAQLRPGNYDVSRRHDYKGHEAWAVNGGGNVPVYRDSNRDGRISDAEKANAVKKGTTGDAILFHWDRNASIGCQTLPVSQLNKLKAAVNGGNFNYTLLDANQAQ